MPSRNTIFAAVAAVAVIGGCGNAKVGPGEGQPGTPGGPPGPGLPGITDGGASGVSIDLAVPPPVDAAAGGPGNVAPPQGETCARETQTAKLTPVDLLLLLDASGSMSEKAGTRTRWELARDALTAFLKDGRSSGLGVGLQLFPLHTLTCNDDGTCFLPSPGGCRTLSACLAPGAPLGSGIPCDAPGEDPCPTGTTCTPLGRCSLTGGDCVGMGQPCKSGMAGDTCGARPRQCRLGPRVRGSCAVADYQKVIVPMSDLPGAADRLIGAIDTRLPVGGTPMAPAVEGALAYLTQRQAASPGRRMALVLVTDGVPEGCGTVAELLADVQAASMRMPALSTYVVGVFGDADPPAARTTVTMLAQAGGTGMPFVISANEQLAEKFLATLNQIRGAALSCDIAIPPPTSGQLDHSKVNVKVGGAAGPKDLVYVERRERCDAAPDGWYYDVAPPAGTPTRVHLCPQACERLKADAQASIELVFGCRSRTIE